MKITLSGAVVGIICATGTGGLAHAGPCYEILDAANRVVYLSPFPPASLANGGVQKFHDELRKAGHHLRWYETYSCPDRSASSPYGSRKKTESPGKLDPDIYLRITPPFGASAVSQGGR